MTEPYTKEEAHAVAEAINTKHQVTFGSAFAKAFAKAQAQVKGAAKDAMNPHFGKKYADLSAVWDACREALTGNGFGVIQRLKTAPNGITCHTMLLHESGEYVEDQGLSLPVAQATAQAYGSAITYARRYSLASMVGVAPEDDDANAAVTPSAAVSQPPAGVEKLKNRAQPAALTGDRQHLQVIFKFGACKGRSSFEVTDKDLEFYAGAARTSIADPEKARFVAANTHELGLIQAEQRYRAQGPAGQ